MLLLYYRYYQDISYCFTSLSSIRILGLESSDLSNLAVNHLLRYLLGGNSGPLCGVRKVVLDIPSRITRVDGEVEGAVETAFDKLMRKIKETFEENVERIEGAEWEGIGDEERGNWEKWVERESETRLDEDLEWVWRSTTDGVGREVEVVEYNNIDR